MPFDKDDQEQETQVNIEEMSADISAELFPEPEETKASDLPEGEAGSPEAKPSAEGSEPPPQTGEEAKGDTDAAKEPAAGEAATDENSQAVKDTGAPDTWSKEALADWASIPPRAQQEILKREEDMHRGIEGYKAAAELGGKVSKIIEPYAPILAAEGVDPFNMLQNFAGNHYLLSRGTPEQKIQLAANLLTGYQIPLPELLEYMADQIGTASEPVDPKLVALEKEVTELKSARNQEREQLTSAALERINQEIDAFAADPKNKYFDELAADIQQLFAVGQAKTLSEAYEKALWSNPSTRQKELDRIAAEKQATGEEAAKKAAEKKAKAQADHVEVNPKSRNGAVITGSIDDTLNEALETIKSRG